MIEYLDVVDERDRPTGALTTTAKAHRDGDLHRIAAVLVFRPDGKLLVQKHKKWGRRLDHSVGGHVSTGEDYAAAARREAAEELGIDGDVKYIATVVPPRGHFEEHDPAIRHTYGVFTAQVGSDWRFVPNDEVDQVVEMTVGDIVALANRHPEQFLKGFLISLGAYLRAIHSSLQIVAYGKNWGEL